VARKPGAFDAGYRAATQLASGEPVDSAGVEKVRFSKDGKTIFLGFSDGKWFQMSSGGGGDKPPPPPGGGFDLGPPDGPPGGWRGFWVPAEKVRELTDADDTRPRYTVFGSGFGREPGKPEWVLLDTPTGTWHLAGGSGALYLVPKREPDPRGIGPPVRVGYQLAAEGKARELLAGLDPLVRDELRNLLADEADPVDRGGQLLAAKTYGDKLFVGFAAGAGWTVSTKPEPGGLLGADSAVRSVRTSGADSFRVIGTELLVPKGATPAQLAEAKQIIDSIGKSAELLAAASRSVLLTGETTKNLRAQYDRLAAAPEFRLEVGANGFTLASGKDTVGAGDLRAWANNDTPLPGGWGARLDKKAVLLDLTGVFVPDGEGRPADPTQVPRLRVKPAQLKTVTDWLGVVANNQRAETYVRVSDDGLAPDRLRGMLNPRDLSIHSQLRSLGKVGDRAVAGVAESWLERTAEAREWLRSGDVVIRLEHNLGEATRQGLADDAAKGVFRGRHVVLGVCNVDRAFFLAFARHALHNGAKSVTIQPGLFDIPGPMLTLELLNHDRAFARSVTETASSPQALLGRAMMETADRLEKLNDRTKTDAEVEKAVAEEFPRFAEATRLFYDAPNGTFKRAKLEETIKHLRAQGKLWITLVVVPREQLFKKEQLRGGDSCALAA
jgi:hypothetical protein